MVYQFIQLFFLNLSKHLNDETLPLINVEKYRKEDCTEKKNNTYWGKACQIKNSLALSFWSFSKLVYIQGLFFLFEIDIVRTIVIDVEQAFLNFSAIYPCFSSLRAIVSDIHSRLLINKLAQSKRGSSIGELNHSLLECLRTSSHNTCRGNNTYIANG